MIPPRNRKGVFSMNRFLSTRNRPFDFTLLFIVCLLLLIGLLFVYSSSYAWAEYKYDDAFFYVKRQLLFASLGIIGMIFIAYIPYYVWRTYVYYIFTFCLLLTVAVLIP